MQAILMSQEMVRAILEGRKTETRRVIRPRGKAPCEVGDLLWVRETWALIPCIECRFEKGCERDAPNILETRDAITEGCFLYRADGEGGAYDPARISWSPSIHMPQQAARIFLRVTDVRGEQLQDIDEDGAAAEGLYPGWRVTSSSTPAASARQAFMWLWQQLTRKAPAEQSWAANPRVWAIRFERVTQEQAGLLDNK